MYSKPLLLSLLVMVALSAGCVYPRTPGEFRKAMRPETFEVQRSYRDVVQFLEKKNNECMTGSYQWSERSSTGGGRGIHAVEPFSSVQDDHAEIYAVQRHLRMNGKEYDRLFVYNLYVTPISKNQTRINLHYNFGWSRKATVRAARAWAQGEDTGCPNLAE